MRAWVVQVSREDGLQRCASLRCRVSGFNNWFPKTGTRDLRPKTLDLRPGTHTLAISKTYWLTPAYLMFHNRLQT